MSIEEQLEYTRVKLVRERFKRNRLALKLKEIEEEVIYLEKKFEDLKQKL